MSLKLELLCGWLLAIAVAIGLLLVSECATQPAHAGELYVDLAGGYTRFLVTTPDGDYLQKDLPHSLDLNSMAYRIGLGWTFNARWSVQGAFVNLGTINQTAKFVDDPDYWAKASKCTANCETAPTYRMTDAYKGWEGTVTRTFAWEPYGLFLKGGGAYLSHRFSINRHDTHTFHRNEGEFWATVAGVGACYKIVCAETTYYHGIGGYCAMACGWAMSQEMLVSFLSIHLPLGG